MIAMVAGNVVKNQRKNLTASEVIRLMIRPFNSASRTRRGILSTAILFTTRHRSSLPT